MTEDNVNEYICSQWRIRIEPTAQIEGEMEMPNKFGGSWTVSKLHVLQQYLTAYLNVMKNQPFDLVYIDGICGIGSS